MVGDCSTEVKQHTREARGSLWLRRLRWWGPTWSAVFEPNNQEGKLDTLILKGQNSCGRKDGKPPLPHIEFEEGSYWSCCYGGSTAPVMHCQTRQTSRPSTWGPLSSSFFQLVASLIEKAIECAIWCTQYVHATPDKPSTQRRSSQCSLKLIFWSGPLFKMFPSPCSVSQSHIQANSSHKVFVWNDLRWS